MPRYPRYRCRCRERALTRWKFATAYTRRCSHRHCTRRKLVSVYSAKQVRSVLRSFLVVPHVSDAELTSQCCPKHVLIAALVAYTAPKYYKCHGSTSVIFLIPAVLGRANTVALAFAASVLCLVQTSESPSCRIADSGCEVKAARGSGVHLADVWARG